MVQPYNWKCFEIYLLMIFLCFNCSNCSKQNGCMPVQHRWCKTPLASLPSPLCCEDLYYPFPNPLLLCIWYLELRISQILHSAVRTSTIPPNHFLSLWWWEQCIWFLELGDPPLCYDNVEQCISKYEHLNGGYIVIFFKGKAPQKNEYQKEIIRHKTYKCQS